MKKIEKTIIFAEGTNLQKLLNYLAGTGLFDELRGNPDNEIIETDTGKVIMKAPSITAKTYPMIWDSFAYRLSLIKIDRPEYENYLFAFENEKNEIGQIQDKHKLYEFHAEIARELNNIKSLLKHRDEKTLNAVEEQLSYCEERLYGFRSD